MCIFIKLEDAKLIADYIKADLTEGCVSDVDELVRKVKLYEKITEEIKKDETSD